MTRFIKKYYRMILIFISSLMLYFPSLFMFYTNDDFFHLTISNAHSFGDFLNFFNIFNPPSNWAFYRPITTQVFYFLSWKIFNLNPFWMHIVSFIFLFGITWLITKLIVDLGGNKNVAFVAAFLYATSATHFGHLYYLGAFQELGMSFFVILSCISFVRQKNAKSVAYFIAALMCKETAVITPLLLIVIFFYQKYRRLKVGKTSKLVKRLIPYLLILVAYMTVRIFSYGFATGDSYVWDFSVRKLANTLVWYLVWSLNLPETLIDFIGPGLKVNPNLFIYWSRQIYPILILFLIQLMGLILVLVKTLMSRLKKIKYESAGVLLFCSLWFFVSLLPVAFLPIHKFTFYLTLPMIGVVFAIAHILERNNFGNAFVILFLVVWCLLSTLTVKHTYNTSWITNGERTAKSVSLYLNINKTALAGKNLVFIDTAADKGLPFSPTATLKTVLSDNNFFKVFYKDTFKSISYGDNGEKDNFDILSRQFIGY